MHIPILLEESVASLNLQAGDLVVDATTNRGGHALEIAKIIGKKGTLICLDLDSQALEEAKIYLEKNLSLELRPKIIYVNDNFRNLTEILKVLKVKALDGLLADLGISSEELEVSRRGFTFQKNEPLLMTLRDKVEENTLTAKKILNSWEEENLADIIYYYGDERYAKRIARNICLMRKLKPLETTFDLVEVIAQSVPASYQRQRIHFATRTFQALRIAVNDELRAEEELLRALAEVLKKGKRASLITFHAGEDRMLKRVVKEEASLKLLKINKKQDFLIPSLEEIKKNVRSRSAKLRIVEKI